MNQIKRLLLFFLLAILLVLSPDADAEGYKKKSRKKKTKKVVKTYKKPVVKRKPQKTFIIDNFSDGNFEKNPEWWKFGNLALSVEKNNRKQKKKLGKYSLHFEGNANHWYIGGCGSYLGIDMTTMDRLLLMVYSPGYNSGLLKIELYDDDNSNWIVDIDLDQQPRSDDVFVHNVFVDWKGWKQLVIPLSEFSDGNPEAGDNVWNPYHIQGSGGLIQIQMIVSTAKKQAGDIDFKLDQIKFLAQGYKKF